MPQTTDHLDPDRLQADLGGLLTNLRLAGLPVYQRDIGRLFQACQLGPPTHRSGFYSLLKCTLAKKPSEERILAEQFDLWWAATADWINELEQTDDPTTTAVDEYGHKQKRTLSSPIEQRSPAKSKQTAAQRWRNRKQKKPRYTLPWRQWIKWWRKHGIAMLLTLLCVTAIASVFWYFKPIPEQPIKPAPTGNIEKPISIQSEFKPVSEYYTWVPEKIEVLERDYWLPILLSLLLASLPLAVLIRRRYKHRSSSPPAAREQWQGPSWRPLLPQHQERRLLQPDELRRGAWAVERFIAAQPTRNLDVPRTVAATCKQGGIPVLHYQFARYPKEIWLWHDKQNHSPAAQQLLEELSQGLSRLALPVQTASFWATPLQVYSDTGKAFSPLDVERRREQVWLFLFSDGQALQQTLASALHGAKLTALLRALSLWPQLAFVNTGSNGDRLKQLLQPFGIDCIQPEQLIGRLGGILQPAGKITPRLQNQLRTWQACACLCADPVSWDTARALLVSLRLTPLSPWYFPALAATGNLNYAGITWTTESRCQALDWLAQSQVFEADKPDASDLGKALKFWRRHYQNEINRRTDIEKAGGKRWTDTPAHLRIKMELAFVALWDKPTQAAIDLYGFYKNPDFNAEIAFRLMDYTCADGDRILHIEGRIVQHIRLPWHWQDLKRNSPLLLQDMGFNPPTGKRLIPRVSGSLAMAMGFFIGLFAIGGFQLAKQFNQLAPVVADDKIFDSPTFQAQVIQQRSAKLGSTRLVAGSAKLLNTVSAKANQQFRVQWSGGWRLRKNFQSIAGGVIWYAGTLAQPIRGCEPDWPRRSLVVLDTDKDNPAAQKLAAVLLDTGSADKVLIGTEWNSELTGFQELPVELSEPDQLIVVTDRVLPNTPSFGGNLSVVKLEKFDDTTSNHLAKALEFERLEEDRLVAMGAAWGGLPGVGSIEGEAEKLRSGPAVAKHTDSTIAFARICGGSFTMGSSEKQTEPFLKEIEDEYKDNELFLNFWKDALKSESPPHIVALDSFDLALTETTNAQYQKFDPDWKYAKELENHPAANLNWNQAKAYCEHYGFRLPSEAEWEYAARGGSQDPWSFGNDAKLLSNYAWFSGNSGNAQAVQTREANPFGLYDMQGNVWEWVSDCYQEDIYQDRKGIVTFNPNVDSTSCTLRSLRGGSAWSRARSLRSAFRDGGRPERRRVVIGFRCARAPVASH